MNINLLKDSSRSYQACHADPVGINNTVTRSLAALVVAVHFVLGSVQASAADESIEFVAEHLPEVAMDNRFATLPLWNGGKTPAGSWQFTVQGAVARTGSGVLMLDGPMVSTSANRQLNDQWSLRALAFLDELRFSGSSDQLPLETLFAQTPLALPAETLFTDLHGTYRNMGAGVAFNLKKTMAGLVNGSG